jgi:putative ATP-binding cassette transporter
MSFREALLTLDTPLDRDDRIAQSSDSDARLRLEAIRVRKSGEEAVLDQRTIDVLPGDRVHIVDRTRSGRNPLLAAVAGLWPWGSGKVQRPPDMTMMFLKRHPYFPPGSLRIAIAFPAEPSAVADSDIKAVLDRVELGHLVGSLDRTEEWGLVLTEDEQVRVGIARLLLHRPPWIFAEYVIDALADEHRDLVRAIFETELARSAVISIGGRTPPGDLFPKVVHLVNGL